MEGDRPKAGRSEIDESTKRGTSDASGTQTSAQGRAPDDHPKAGSPNDQTKEPKRKRRRRSRRGKNKAGVAPSAVQDAAIGVAPREEKAGEGHSRRSRSRKRRRALQGRPLGCASAQASDTGAGPGAEVDAHSFDDRSAPMREDAGERSPVLKEDQLKRPFRGVEDEGRGPRGRFVPPLYAALDLGTNNCRLLIAQPTRPGQFRVVDAFSRIVRLGEGLIASGRLSPGAMDRAVAALKICAGKLDGRPIRARRLIATEACRAAANGAEFLERVRTEAGLDLEIVDRETEARLAVSGCSSLVGRDARSVVLFDIGGGSSEIAVIKLSTERGGRLSNHSRAWTSLPVGVVTLSEQHGGREVTRQVFEAMVADVERMLGRFDCPRSLTGHEDGSDAGFHLLGTSGTVTTLAGIYLDLPRYDRRRVDGLWLSDEDVDRMMERLLSWDFDQRSANPCIGADRADLVLAGCAILQAIRRRWPAKRMRVADRGLREGLLTEMMAADGAWRRQRWGRTRPQDQYRGGAG